MWQHKSWKHNTINKKMPCKYKNMLQTIEMHDAGSMDDNIDVSEGH